MTEYCSAFYTCDMCDFEECFWCDSGLGSLCSADVPTFRDQCIVLTGEISDSTCPPPATGRCHLYGESCGTCAASPLPCQWCANPLDGFRACMSSTSAALACKLAFGGDVVESCPIAHNCTGRLPTTIYVSPSAPASPDCCCGDESNPCKTVACGLTAATRIYEDAIVVLKDGVYREFDIDVPLRKKMTLKAENIHGAIINADRRGRVMTFSKFLGEVHVEGIQLINGTGPGGGCVLVSEASPSFHKVIIADCEATEAALGPVESKRLGIFGGGAYFEDSFSVLTEVLIEHNTANEDISEVYGVGLYAITSGLMLSGVTVQHNSATCTGPCTVSGVGLVLEQAAEDTVLRELSVRNNTVVATAGGVCEGIGMTLIECAISMSNSTLKHNSGMCSGRAYGGGMHVISSSVALIGVAFEENEVTSLRKQASGGGLHVSDGQDEGSVLDGCIFSHNRAVGLDYANGFGGGMSTQDFNPVYVRTCVFRRNSARTGFLSANGGGLYVSKGPVTVTTSTFEGNQAVAATGFARGGGVYMVERPRTSASLVSRCVFRGNSVATTSVDERATVVVGGGGMAVTLGAYVTVRLCTFEENTARGQHARTGGGGLLFFGDFLLSPLSQVKDCVFARNFVVAAEIGYGGGFAVEGSYPVNLYNITVEFNRIECTAREASISQMCYGGGIGSDFPGQLIGIRARGNTVVGAATTGGGLALTSLRDPLGQGTFLLEDADVFENLVNSSSEGASVCHGAGLSVLGMWGEVRTSHIHDNTFINPAEVCQGAGVAAIRGASSFLITFSSSVIENNIGFANHSIFGGGGGGVAMYNGRLILSKTRICGNTEPNVVCSREPCWVEGDGGFIMDGVGALPVVPANSCPTELPGVCSTVCSGHGSCNLDTCSCDLGFYGELCSLECNGGSSPPCSGHGVCDQGVTGSGTCECQAGYFGTGCSEACPNNCSARAGAGACRSGESSLGGCDCAAGYYGVDCSRRCPGYFADVFQACFGRGTCDDGHNGTGVCTCADGFGGNCTDCIPGRAGFGCDVTCPGPEDSPCNGNGVCNDGASGDGKCTCHEFFYGPACNGTCPGGLESVCFGHGVCADGAKGSGRCTCEGRWDPDRGCAQCKDAAGPACSILCPRHNGLPCGGAQRGMCRTGTEANGTCVCVPGTFGSACEMSCVGFVAGGRGDEICSGHGTCDPENNGTCQCGPGYNGAGCQQSVLGALAAAVDDGENGGSDVGAVVGVAVLFVVLILGGSFVLFIIWFKQLFCFAAYISESDNTVVHVKNNENQMKEYVQKLLTKRTTRHVGAGGAADVYKAKLEDGTWVALKQLRSRSPLLMEEFHREVLLLSSFSAMGGHRHVIGLHFYCEDPPCIALDICERGSLSQVLFSKRTLTCEEQVNFVEETCSGMEYIHEQGVAHLDLKPDNLLLSAEGIKITDFGISMKAKDADFSGNFSGTIQYMAPERFSEEPYDLLAADVFSFGLLMWVIWQRLAPFEQSSLEISKLRMAGKAVAPPPLPSDCPELYGSLLALCWDDVPASRPPFSVVAKCLQHLEEPPTFHALLRPAECTVVVQHDVPVDSFQTGEFASEEDTARKSTPPAGEDTAAGEDTPEEDSIDVETVAQSDTGAPNLATPAKASLH